MNRIFDRPLLYPITTGELTAANFAEKSPAVLALVARAVESRIALIQLREKLLPARLLFELAERAARLTKNSPTRLLVNDRADVALAARADGVHLTAGSLPAHIIRTHFPPPFIVGVSTHAAAEVVAAGRAGADFATFGPVFETESKKIYGPPQGVEKLREAVAAAGDLPVVALGGIDEHNFRETLAAGARGIAAIKLLNDPERIRRMAGLIFDGDALLLN
ncbi:MAG: thiamine phosphate synthase [Acidobacteria bacterium]|nr:thiamine phosphate synthase [Acidobacteriota bacterium]